jgi:hypothetical protein
MTLQSFAPPLIMAPPARRPLWRRLIDAIAASREREAERQIAKYLRHYRRELYDDFARELERRLLGH